MKIMEISILKNDAFRLMSSASGYPENILEEMIIKRMIDEGMMAGDQLDCGCSIQHIGFSSGYDATEIMDVLFPEGKDNPELIQLFDAIVFWGDGSDHPCPICGCECEGETDSTDGTPSNITWTNWKCTNGECDFADSGEPDWDVLPGGYAYKSEN